MQTKRTSDLLIAYANGEDVSTEIFNRFYPIARAHAQKRISRYMRRRIGPSSIVQIAFRSALSALKSGQVEVECSGDFRNVLLAIIHHKSLDAVRKEKTKSRSVEREKKGPDDIEATAAPDRPLYSGKLDMALSPENIATVNESIKKLVDHLVGESSRLDQIDQAIASLHFFGGWEVKEIHDWLEKESQKAGTKSLGVRSIQIRIKNILAWIREDFVDAKS